MQAPTAQQAASVPEELAPFVRHLNRILRTRPTVTLEEAKREAVRTADPGLVEAASEVILARRTWVSNNPKIPIIRGETFEPWYAGPDLDVDRCWPALRTELAARISGEALEAVDDSSTKVVANLQNPGEIGATHGLVLGFVQSGKTTNFTAVIAKAADVGYRFFIVLSGVHNSLRQQTQDRLSDELWELNTDLWNRLTESSDFRPSTNNVDSVLSSNSRILVVVKKNATVLRRLKTWLSRAEPHVLAKCPILVIDDEADQASVNTAAPGRDPKAINRLIRDIVKVPAPVSYVGYTATPFANVLIDPQDLEDLYPRDFVLSLPKPKEYLGPETLFGRDPLDEEDEGYDPADDGYDMIRTVPDNDVTALRPATAAGRFGFDATVPPSLDDALRYFLLSSAARRVRRRLGANLNPHATALIHTSQHVQTHQTVADAVRKHLTVLADALASGDQHLTQQLRAQWDDETLRVPADAFGLTPVPWGDLEADLVAVAQEVRVITDNSYSDERLHFDPDQPRTLVAVGGNTLSRGLTLEGLAVSYFVRSASAYDTVLQMGRWFGYRAGYIDLTRIWMTAELESWFRHLATVETEIRNDIARYENSPLTPLDVGVRIRTHPSMAITAASKMRGALAAKISYSGRRVQNIVFRHRDQQVLGNNLAAARALLTGLSPRPAVGHTLPPGVTVFKEVEYSQVLDFVDSYRFHPDDGDLSSKLLRDYINSCLAHGELEEWTVAVMGRAEDSDLGVVDLGLGSPVGQIRRSRLNQGGDADIKALMSRPDRAIDLDMPVRRRLAGTVQPPFTPKKLARLRNRPAEGGFGDGSPLLLLYPISPHSRPLTASNVAGPPRRVPLDAVDTVVGVGLVFPETNRSSAVDYLTVDLSGVAVEAPDAEDEPAEDR